MLGNKLIGPYVFDNNLTGNAYEVFLRNELPALLEDIPLNMYVCIYVCMYVLYVCMYVYIYVCVYVCVCMYVCMCVCMYVCVYV